LADFLAVTSISIFMRASISGDATVVFAGRAARQNSPINGVAFLKSSSQRRQQSLYRADHHEIREYSCVSEAAPRFQNTKVR
jgi:hypothetical protein